MVYHQAFLERSAIDNKWNLGPIAKRISVNFKDDSSDDSMDEEDAPKDMKVSKETFKELTEGI